MDWKERITSNPGICGGVPIIRGTRIPVSVVLDNLAELNTHEEILESYPTLKREDLGAAMHYAAELARDPIIVLAHETVG